MCYDLRTYLAVALYFVTYYHPINPDCKRYLQKNEFKDDLNLQEFTKESENYFKHPKRKFGDQIEKEQLKIYKLECKRSVLKSEKKLV